MVQRSDVPSQENQGQASGDRLHLQVSPGIQKSQKKEGQIWKVVIGCQKENGRMWSIWTQRVPKSQCASIGRPISVHGDRGRRHTKPAECGSRHEIESVNKGGGKSHKDVRKIRSDKRPSQNSTVVLFLTRLHVGIIPKEHIRRDLHQRLSERFFLKHAGHTEHADWESS